MNLASGTGWILKVLADLRDAAKQGNLVASAEALQAAMDTYERETVSSARRRGGDGSGMDDPY